MDPDEQMSGNEIELPKDFDLRTEAGRNQAEKELKDE